MPDGEATHRVPSDRQTTKFRGEPSTLQRAIETLTNPQIETKIREALETWPDADPAMVARTLAWITALRDDLCNLLRTIEDDEQIAETLAINYIELKSRWIALNTKANYCIFRTGVADAESAFRGTSISMLLGEVEGLLTPTDITTITEFLAQPIRRAA
ncbi:MAG: hypothetical protein ACK5WB_03465 [Phycisphaerales bacterium]|nr:hypothetical protein [Phycisphaeraceae bacterium]